MEIMFASFRTGMIALPLNWRLSEAELLRVLEDGEPAFVFFSPEYETLANDLSTQFTRAQWIGFSDSAQSSY